MPVPPVPQTGRTPADLNDPNLRAALRQRHAQDDRDLFAADADVEVRTLGRIALRRAQSLEAVRDLLALGDVCARRTRTNAGRLRVFYAGKALTAYRRGVSLADVRGQWDDGQDGRRAIDAFIAWLVACADETPARRNIAVALWAVAEYDELLSHTPFAVRAPNGGTLDADGDEITLLDGDPPVDGALSDQLTALEQGAGFTLEALLRSAPLKPTAAEQASSDGDILLSGDTLSDTDASTYADITSSLRFDSTGEMYPYDARGSFSADPDGAVPSPKLNPIRALPQAPSFSDLGDQIARMYLNNHTLDEVVSRLLLRYSGMDEHDLMAFNLGEVPFDTDTPMDAPNDPRAATITTSMLYANPTLLETQTHETPVVPPPRRRAPSKTAPEGNSGDVEPSSSNLDMTNVAYPDARAPFESNGSDAAALSETRHELGAPGWMPSVDSGIDYPELADERRALDPAPHDADRSPGTLLGAWSAAEGADAANDAVQRADAERLIDADEFGVGSLIDHRYEVVNVKRGGMGVVYLCYDRQRREPVALKSFQSRFFNNDRARARFGQEAWTWIRLEKHRHIVQARLVQTIEGRPHLILEHVSGPEGLEADLRSWIERKRLTLALSLKFGLHIALGMQHAAQKVPGLVHRDLKPANILVTHDEVAKVTDFGLVRSIEDDLASDAGGIVGSTPNGSTSSGASSPTGDDARIGSGIASSAAPTPTLINDERLTKFGALVGTLPYMSPEQCQALDVDQRADIYAFGCLLYEMLTGSHIFPARKKEAWLHAHIHERPVFSPIDAGAIPPVLQTLVLTCLEKHPDDRPPSWSALVDSLAAIYQDVIGEPPVLEVSGFELEARELMDKAYSLTELGRADEALIAYDRAIALQPKNAWAWARKARALRLLNRHHEALTIYDEALRLDPAYAWALKGKGIVLERLGDLEGALESHERAARLDPNDVWHWHNQGDIFQKMGRYDDALAMLEAALRVDPQHANTWAKMGQVLRLMRQHEQALVAYERALEIEPKYAWAHNGCGLTFKAMGKFERALMSFRRAARTDPRIVWHWYNVTEMLVELGQYEEALPSAREAVRISPDHTSAWGKLGQVLRYLKRYDEALTAYDRAIQLQPNFAWAHNGKGIIYEQMGRYDDALTCYQAATQYGSIDASHWYNQGNALSLLGRLDEALPLLERAIKIKPDFRRAWARLGGTLRLLGRASEAVEALRTATTLDPTNAWAWSEMGRALEALQQFDDAANAQRRAAQSKPDHAIYLTQHADALFNRGDYDDAFDVLEQALKIDPRNPRAWARRGQVLRRLHRQEEALRSYQRALDLDPRYAWAWAGRAMAELALHLIDEALDSFHRAIELDPADVWYRYTLGDTLVTLNRFQDAADILAAAARVDPAHPDVWAKLGQAYRRLRRHPDALHAYDKALALKPDHAWAWNGRGLSLEALGRREEAIASYRRALVLDQGVIWYYTNLVDLLLAQRQYADALELMDIALHALPDNPIAWARHGQVLRRTGAYDDAILSYQRALELDPTYAWAWNGMGLANAALGQWQPALECYRESVRYNADDVWFWYNFGDALLVIGEIKSAIAMFEKALALDPTHEPSQKKLKTARDHLGE